MEKFRFKLKDLFSSKRHTSVIYELLKMLQLKTNYEYDKNPPQDKIHNSFII